MIRLHPILSKLLLITASLSLAFVAIMGFAHTKPGRPLLKAIGPLFGMSQARAHSGSGHCPFGFDVAPDPAKKELARASFAAAHRGNSAAAVRLALGFSLDQTTRAEVQAWADAHGVKCSVPRVGADLDCSEIPAAALPLAESGPAIESLWFNFNRKQQLASLIAIRKDQDPRSIVAAFASTRDSLSEKAGAPSSSTGEPTAENLSAGLLRQVSVEYKFSDYYALARAGNMGDGFVLTEEFRSLN